MRGGNREDDGSGKSGKRGEMKHKRKNGRYAKSALMKRIHSYWIREQGISKKQGLDINRRYELKMERARKQYKESEATKQ